MMKLITIIIGIITVYIVLLDVQAMEIKWSAREDVSTLDPHAPNNRIARRVINLVYEPLTRFDAFMIVRPVLAKKWSWENDNPTRWKFYLREGVRFHDHQFFTARDVVFSLQRAKAKGSGFSSILHTVSRVTKIDDYTVEITTNGYDPELPERLTRIYIMSRDWARENGIQVHMNFDLQARRFTAGNMNGTGPFKHNSRISNASITFERNDNWWGGSNGNTYFERVVFIPIPDNSARIQNILDGNLAFALDISPSDVHRLRKIPEIDIIARPNGRTIFLGMNQDRQTLFADRRVRQAIYQAINIGEIHNQVMNGFSIAAGTIPAPGLAGYSGALGRRLPYDIDEARRLLSEAGHREFSLTLDCPTGIHEPIQSEEICRTIARMLHKIGIDVTVKVADLASHVSRIQRRESDFYLGSWRNSPFGGEELVDYLVKQIGRFNFTGYTTPELKTLINSLWREYDGARRKGLVRQVLQMVKDDFVYVPLHHELSVWAVRKPGSNFLSVFADSDDGGCSTNCPKTGTCPQRVVASAANEDDCPCPRTGSCPQN